MKVAVIGSGIAGLSACWYLQDKHEVTLFERGSRVGMDAHSVEVDTPKGSVYINVPMRVFFEGYYPTLTALYTEAGIPFEPVNYAASFSQLHGDTYFRYNNLRAGPYSLPMLAGKSLLKPQALGLGAELLRFLNDAKRHGGNLQRSEKADKKTLADWLASKGYSQRFAEQFLYPAFAGICTCDYDSVAAYPAGIILEYLASDLISSSVHRLTNGVYEVTDKLAKAAKDVCYNTKLKGIRATENGVEITDQNGATELFDHAVIATQANKALELLAEPTAEEQDALSQIRYESGRIVVHRDEALAPDNKGEWAPVNFLLSATEPRPMASIWLNRIYPELEGQANIFESWNPLVEPATDKILVDATVDRPVVTQASLQAIKGLEKLHQQTDRKIWFCGSYSRRGIPLLENAVASAKSIAGYLVSA
ncbi:MAG: FAD-dependent oxidoreductase [Gammaproteobacteria bacterium]|nr:FAD-dependent oxidoreductase [Gammaproteobacteria bacterium]